MAVGLWAFVAVVAGTAYPAFVQQFRVEPDGVLQGGALHRAQHRGHPRRPSGCRRSRPSRSTTTTDRGRRRRPPSRTNPDTIRNVRLLDPTIVPATYQKLQAGPVGFYQFDDLDVDRYPIERDDVPDVPRSHPGRSSAPATSTGRHPAAVVGGPRTSPTPTATAWRCRRPTRPTTDGQPDFLVRDVPVRGRREPASTCPIDQPQLYFGENQARLRHRRHHPRRGRLRRRRRRPRCPAPTRATAGWSSDSFARKAAFALRFGDWNPLVSQLRHRRLEDHATSRDVRDRVETVAPFLAYDSDPYPVVADGRIVLRGRRLHHHRQVPERQQADTDGPARDSGLCGGASTTCATR